MSGTSSDQLKKLAVARREGGRLIAFDFVDLALRQAAQLVSGGSHPICEHGYQYMDAIIRHVSE